MPNEKKISDKDNVKLFAGDKIKYPVASLRKEKVNLSVVQTRVSSVDPSRAEQELRHNLDYMIESIDKAFYWNRNKDLLLFHEMPLMGWRKWNREEALRVAIDVPGEETEAIGKKAKEHSCYIVFATLAKDPDWPNHVLHLCCVVGPNGELLDKHWKVRNMRGVFDEGFELFTTTIYDVYDRYIEMYGKDSVIPITRTDVGNLMTSSAVLEPEVARAGAMKGAEIIMRLASGGFSFLDTQCISLHNNVYVAVSNQAISPENYGFPEDFLSGSSAIFGPFGKEIARAGKHEEIISADLDIGSLRRTDRILSFNRILYQDIYDSFPVKHPPNTYLEYLPKDIYDAADFLESKCLGSEINC